MTPTPITIKRALVSVSDKTGLIELCQHLTDVGIEIISTGGTSKTLSAAQISHIAIEDFTKMQEIFSGRVKTLHPKIHGGILGLRDEHAAEAAAHDIQWIDLVIVNFYPFAKATANPNLSFAEAIEYIDVGGPTMVRAAAKNLKWVTVVTDPADYPEIISCLRQDKSVTFATRQKLAAKVFALTAEYDAAIAKYFQRDQLTEAAQQKLHLHFAHKIELRYGENPHQKAAAYYKINDKGEAENGILDAKQLQGKDLSYNNILDSNAALQCVSEFQDCAAVIIKHANPCGVASADSIEQAFELALACDLKSAFGGIVALNRECSAAIANNIQEMFMEVIIAPDFTTEALEIFAKKPNLRILKMPVSKIAEQEYRFIQGGLLIQETDVFMPDMQQCNVVTRLMPTAEQYASMAFAWKVLKHMKSNAILLAKNNRTIGLGAGQVARIDAVELAVRKAGDNIANCILASDAFFPFRDSIDFIAEKNIKSIIQPGGSMRDQDVIDACNENNISMVFTRTRCFKH